MRSRSFLAAFGLVASALALVQPTAGAAPQTVDRATATCSLKMPARLAMRDPNTTVKVPLGSDCPETLYQGSWVATVNGRQVQPPFATGCGYGSACTVLVRYTPIGQTVKWVPLGPGGDYQGNKVADLLPAVSVTKYSSTASLVGGRKGSRTAFIAAAAYFNPKTNAFTRWTGKKMLLQYQEIGTSTWKGLTYLTTNASGQATYTYYPNRTRRYRLYVYGTSSVWDFYTPAISR